MKMIRADRSYGFWILNDRKIIHTSEFQKPLEWFGEHTIEEAVEILSTETNII